MGSGKDFSNARIWYQSRVYSSKRLEMVAIRRQSYKWFCDIFLHFWPYLPTLGSRRLIRDSFGPNKGSKWLTWGSDKSKSKFNIRWNFFQWKFHRMLNLDLDLSEPQVSHFEPLFGPKHAWVHLFMGKKKFSTETTPATCLLDLQGYLLSCS